MEAVHNLAEDNKIIPALKAYTLHRDKMFIVASEDVVKAMLRYEDAAVGKPSVDHDKYLTLLVIAIRKDLKIRDKSFPQIYLKASKK